MERDHDVPVAFINVTHLTMKGASASAAIGFLRHNDDIISNNKSTFEQWVNTKFRNRQLKHFYAFKKKWIKHHRIAFWLLF